MTNSHLYIIHKRETLADIKGKGQLQTYWIETSDVFDVEQHYSDVFNEIFEMIANMENKSCSWKMPSPMLLTNTLATLNNSISPIHSPSANQTSTISLDTSDDIHSEASSHKPLKRSKVSDTELGVLKHTISFTQLSSVEYSVMDIDADDHFLITHLIMKMIEGMCNLQAINVDKVILYNYIGQVSSHYNMVPYHNFHHAFCVVQFTTALLTLSNAIRFLSPRDIFALLVSALTHDVGHVGLNNAYAIKTKSDLAILYNNESVLEHHHIALTFSLMNSDESNILERWNSKDREAFQTIVTQCILSTDMKLHDGMVDEALILATEIKANDFMTNDISRVSICRYLLHGADIANSVRPYTTSNKITKLIVAEFRMQVKQEAEHKVEVTSFMMLPDDAAIAKNEIFFIGNVKSFWLAMVGIFDELLPLVTTLESNLDEWKSSLDSKGTT